MPEPVTQELTIGLSCIPEVFRPKVESQWRALEAHLPVPTGNDGKLWLRSLPQVFASSDFVARTCEQSPAVLRDLLESGDLFRAYDSGELAQRVRAGLTDIRDEAQLKSQLRVMRRRESVRIAWRDLAGWADLDEVVATLSEFADACIDASLGCLFAWMKDKHGEPTAEESGVPVSMAVLGLGKLGARELNFSSDVDLMFAYAQEGQTRGDRPLSNHEFFIRLGQALINVLSEPTHDGFVFRVDMRLRPNGNSGPLALSHDAMELYYQTHGRDWERYALIKARVVGGDRKAGDELLARLRPFVFRKYLDYGAFEAIRSMKAMIEREVQRKGMQNNVKLGSGGIREIEFIGQALQLIRGGREPALQARGILTVLRRLEAAGYITSQAEADLTAAYLFLRDTEHRLQMVADRQTHMLPTEPKEHLRLAVAMGFPDWNAFANALARYRRKVHEHFSSVFVAPQGEAPPDVGKGLSGVWLDTVDRESALGLLQSAGYERPDEVLSLLRGLREGPAYSAFSAEGRSRMDRLIPLLLAAAGLAPDPHNTLSRLVRLLEAIGRRTVYLALLIENPMALSQLVRLCSASPWIATWLSQHPIVLDELLDPRGLYTLPDRAGLEAEIRERLDQIAEDDTEAQMDVLREFRHGHVLRVAAAAIGPGLAPERVGAQLAAIAEVVLAECLRLANEALVRRYGRPTCRQDGVVFHPGFALIAYGKLGSYELGYASDLDMIFLYESCEPQGRASVARGMTPRTEETELHGEQRGRMAEAAGEADTTDGARSLPNEQFFARLGQRLIHYLTARTPGGILYEVDMRLRPSGKAGTLVASLPAFRAYQEERAWTWEHQALVRARPVAGKPELCRAFQDVRREILCRPRDPGQLKGDVREMRAKMVEAHASREPGMFDVKHERGGIVDIEFMVQYWVLRWAHDHPDLTRYTDNINILEALARESLLDADRTRLLVSAYRRYLSIEHRLKLMERGSLVPRAEVADLPDRVLGVWNQVFAETPTEPME